MVSPIRFSGLATGMDTEQMVRDLMKVQRQPLNKAKQQQQWQVWQRERYRDLNTMLTTFREKTVFNMKLQGSFVKKTAVSDNETTVTAKSVGKSSLSSYSVEVMSFAKPATSASVKLDMEPGFFRNATTPIGKLMDDQYDPNPENPSVTYNMKFTIVGHTGEAGKQEININANDTLNSIVNKINAYSDQTGVRAAINLDDQSITFISINAGTDSNIEIRGLDISGTNKDGSSITNADNWLGIKEGKVGTTPNFGQVGVEGDKLRVKLNGVEYQFNSNTFTFDGIEFGAKQIGTTVINLKNDDDAFFNSIKVFVDKYNEVLTRLNKEISEPRYRNFHPLSKEETDEMKENEIKLWEEKAKSGLLRNDSILSSLSNQMRTGIYGSVEGVSDPLFNNLASIGINTAKYIQGSPENGTLVIDEDKLREAIRENPDSVMELFTKTSSATNDSQRSRETGLAGRLDSMLKVAMDNISDIAGKYVKVEERDDSSLGKSIGNLNNRINQLETVMKRKEQQYYSQFAQLEKAISQMNSQSASIMSFFSQGQ